LNFRRASTSGDGDIAGATIYQWMNGNMANADASNADLTLKQRDDIALDPNLVNNDEGN
jgi:hypothetical protein